jgi:hypothetical protein
MFNLEYDDDIGREPTRSMTRWNEFNEQIKSNSKLANNKILHLAHSTVKYKLESAYFHRTTLVKAYNLKSSKAKTLLKRSMLENIIINLSSSFVAIAHEINQIYEFNIPFERVQIDHYHKSECGKNCMRCKLDSKANSLAKYIRTELPRSESKQLNLEHWYFSFQRYRNQIIHRTIYVLMLETGKDFLPDDPAILDPLTDGIKFIGNFKKPVYPNYTKRREIREYSESCLTKAIQICERIYEHLGRWEYKDNT